MLTATCLEKTYGNGVKALNGVSLRLPAGQSVALVGESGCGKSTLARVLCRLDDADAGELAIDGLPYTSLRGRPLRALRKRVQMVFQDSGGALDPRHTVRSALAEPLGNFEPLSHRKREERIIELLQRVGLRAETLNSYPHQLSGGQRQRVIIARALAASPDYLVCDEPVSSLDADTQQQVIELLQALQRDSGMGMLFITHDLSIAKRVSNRILVMLEGRIVEELSTPEAGRARHPYTRSLFAHVFEPVACHHA